MMSTPRDRPLPSQITAPEPPTFLAPDDPFDSLSILDAMREQERKKKEKQQRARSTAEVKQAVAAAKSGNALRLQRILRKAGFQIDLDGVWGPQSQQAWDDYRKRLTKKQASLAMTDFSEKLGKQAARDARKSPGAKDKATLTQRYGFLGAQEIERERNRKAVERKTRNQAVYSARPGPEPAPSIGERIGAFLGDLQGGGGTSDRTKISAAGVNVGGELLTRPLQVWGTSLYYAARDPRKIPEDIQQIAQGFSQLLGGIGAAAASNDPKLMVNLAKQFVNAYKESYYGEDWKEIAKDDPLFNILDAVAAGNIAARGVSVLRDIGRGMTVREALRASYNPTFAGRTRTISRVVDNQLHTVELPQAKSPVGRAVNRGWDRVSSYIPESVPGSEAKRVARQEAKMLRNVERRNVAQALAGESSLISAPNSRAALLIPGSTNETARVRLFWESQLEPDLRNNAGMKMLRDRINEHRANLAAKGAEASDYEVKSIARLDIMLNDLDKAIQYKPDGRYYKALSAMDTISDITDEGVVRAFSYEGFRPNALNELHDLRRQLVEIKEMPGRTGEVLRNTVPGGPDTQIARIDSILENPERVLDDAGRPIRLYQPELGTESEVQRTAWMFLDEAREWRSQINTNRRMRLSEWVRDGEAQGKGAFVPHEASVPGIGHGGVPSRPVILEDADLRSLHLNKYNELEYVKSGRIVTDPDLLALHTQKVFALEMMDEVRRHLWDSGRPLTIGDPISPGDVLVKMRGSKTPRWFLDEISANNFDELTDALDSFRKEFVSQATPENLDDLVSKGWLRKEEGSNFYTIASDDFRAVPKAYANDLLYYLGGGDTRRILGKATRVGASVDAIENIVKIAILYSNPGYYPANLIGNMLFLAMNSDPVTAVADLYRAGKLHQRNPRLWNMLAAEVGEGPAAGILKTPTGMVAGGGGKIEKTVEGTLNVQRRIAYAAGAVDRGPRVAAMLRELRRAGYTSDEAIERLLKARSGKNLSILDQVTTKAREAMVDFDASTPFEQQYIRRLIFVYPWLRGASKWAKDFVLNTPERAAVTARLAQGATAEANARWGEHGVPLLPEGLRHLFPVARNENVASVINARSINPVSTLADILKVAEGFAAPGVPAPKYQTLKDYLNPMWQAAMMLSGAENQFGQNVGYLGAASDTSADIIPFKRLIDTLRGDVSKVYKDKDPLSGLERSALRVTPYRIDLTEAEASAIRAGEKRPDYPLTGKRADLRERAKSIGEELPGYVEDALSWLEAREEMNHDAKKGKSGIEARIAGLQADAELLWRGGIVSDEELDQMKSDIGSWARVSEERADEGLTDWKTYMTDVEFERLYGLTLRDYDDYLEARGG